MWPLIPDFKQPLLKVFASYGLATSLPDLPVWEVTIHQQKRNAWFIEIWNPYTPQTFVDIYSMSFYYITINFQIPTLLISMPDICCCLFCSRGNLDSVIWLYSLLCSLRLCSLVKRALWGTTKKLNLDFQNSLVQTNYLLPHPYSPSLLTVMCYPAPISSGLCLSLSRNINVKKITLTARISFSAGPSSFHPVASTAPGHAILPPPSSWPYGGPILAQ